MRNVGAQTQKKLGPGVPPPEGWGREGGPKGGRGQNFALFFPSLAPIFALFLSLWGSSRGILVVFEAPGPSTVHVCALGFQTCTFEFPSLQKHHQREDHQREKRAKMEAGEEKKRAKFWEVRGRGSCGGGS